MRINKAALRHVEQNEISHPTRNQARSEEVK